MMWTEKVRKHPWNNGHCITGVGDGQYTQEEVHGGMEVTVQANNGHNDHIARESQQVQTQKDNKEDKPVLPPKAGKSFEEEVGYQAGV